MDRHAQRARTEAGFGTVEVLVSIALLVVVAFGTFAALEAAHRTSAFERHRSRAHGIAQDDEARMRGGRIGDLANLNRTRTVTQDGVAYTVVSRGQFITDATGTASCATSNVSADRGANVNGAGSPAS